MCSLSAPEASRPWSGKGASDTEVGVGAGGGAGTRAQTSCVSGLRTARKWSEKPLGPPGCTLLAANSRGNPVSHKAVPRAASAEMTLPNQSPNQKWAHLGAVWRARADSELSFLGSTAQGRAAWGRSGRLEV